MTAGSDLSARHYVYIWADGVYLQARMEPEAECILVIIGATPEGKKELLGFHVGTRESAQSWRELLVDLKARGLTMPPELAVGDGALGFWKAMDEIYPATRHQRCWFHKISNILGKLPRSMAAAVKADLQEIHHAETKAAARAAINIFKEKYGVKYAPAVACLTKDEEALLAFYDFPAEHSHDRRQPAMSKQNARRRLPVRRWCGCARQGVELRRRLSRLSYAG